VEAVHVGWQVAVSQPQPGALTGGLERDLDGALTGGQRQRPALQPQLKTSRRSGMISSTLPLAAVVRSD